MSPFPLAVRELSSPRYYTAWSGAIRPSGAAGFPLPRGFPKSGRRGPSPVRVHRWGICTYCINTAGLSQGVPARYLGTCPPFPSSPVGLGRGEPPLGHDGRGIAVSNSCGPLVMLFAGRSLSGNTLRLRAITGPRTGETTSDRLGQPLLEPVVCVGLVVKGFHLAVSATPVELDGLLQDAIRFEPKNLDARVPRVPLEFLE